MSFINDYSVVGNYFTFAMYYSRKFSYKILLQYEIPQHVLVWYHGFISNRSQFVRIGNSVSNVLTTNAGSPQGTITRPDDFKLLINDLKFELNTSNMLMTQLLYLCLLTSTSYVCNMLLTVCVVVSIRVL